MIHHNADARLNLPALEVLPELRQALQAGRNAIVMAPPGSGKTTMLPLALMNDPWLGNKTILLLEPRRVAARAAAWRMADLKGEQVGRSVGYRMRLERRDSATTRILVVVEGLMVNRLLQDPELKGVGMVIFDEFHERSLQADLAFALCRDVQQSLRPDLRILVMSATLNASRIAPHLGDCVVLESAGRQYPVQTVLAPRPAHERLPAQVAAVCAQALREQEGGVLAFLPGEGEIRATARLLEESTALRDIPVLPLYAALSKAEQDRTLRPAPPGKRKLVLATSIAESSITIEGIKSVVDCGWVRVARYSSATGMQRLETTRITKDRADQRRGRAGRQEPGVCYRIWDSATDTALVPAAQPEILTADLAGLVLALADWGVGDIAELPWITEPPEAAREQAALLLKSLGALDSSGRVTAHGRGMARLPMHPRPAHMLLRAKDNSMLYEASLVAALLAEPAAMRGGGGRNPDSGLRKYLDALIKAGGSGGQREAHPSKHVFGRETERRLQQLAADWRSSLGGAAARPRATFDEESLALMLIHAFPEHIGKRRGPRSDPRYLLANGRGASLNPEDPMAECEWIVALETDDSAANARIRLAAEIPADKAEDLLKDRITRRQALEWDRRNAMVKAAEIESVGAIKIRERPVEDADPAAVLACLCDGIRAEGLHRLSWSPAARQLQARVALLRENFPQDDWPDFSDRAIADNLESILEGSLFGMRRLSEAARVDLAEPLLNLLTHARRRELARLAPTHFTLPTGGRIRLNYTLSETPVLAVRIQEVFGLRSTPSICGGRVPLLLHLLSPARRPVQITADLPSFWRSGYSEARKQLRGRYPKHHWPEDPTEP